MKRRVATLAAALAVIGASVGAVGLASLTGKTARGPQVITVPEDYRHPIDLRPGDTLNLIMNPDGGQQDRCDHAGGSLSHNVRTGIDTCVDVDH